MKPRTKIFAAILLALAVLPWLGTGAARAQAPGPGQSPVQAEVDRTELSTDETLLLTVTVRSTSLLNSPSPELPDLTGFNVVGSSTSTQVSIVNADVVSQSVHQYRLQPYQTGDLVIGPVRVTVRGQTFSTEPIAIRVSQGNGSSAAPPSSGQPATASTELTGQDLFVEAEIDNPAPFVGQQVLYTFRFYQAVNLWDQPQYEPPAFTGFWSEADQDQQEYQLEAAGRVYRVTELSRILFPSVVGPVTIEPARLEVPGGFFRSGQTLQTKPIEVNVQPLPADAPPGFGGAVGQFTLETGVDATQGKANEPLTWRITLRGEGNLNALPDPAWPDMPGWRTFESQATVHTEVRDGRLAGERVYERLLVPSAGGEYTLPSLEYIYFDPIAGQYQTLHSEPIAVSIAPGDPAGVATLSATGDTVRANEPTAADTLAQPDSDIRHLKPVPETLAPAGKPLTASGLYWLAWAFPAVGAIGYFAWQRRQRYWENNLGLARSSRARKKARKALAQARREKGDAYSAASQILTTYLGDKLDRPVAGLTHQALAELLAGRGVGRDLTERVEVLLVTGELGRYAPGAEDPGHAQSLLQEVEFLIADLEKVL
jgi:hypothetical protein